MMTNLSERDRNTLRIGGIAAGAILVFMVVVSPLLAQWDGLNTSIEKNRQSIKNLNKDASDTVEAQGKLKELVDMARVLPDPEGLNQQTAQMLHQVQMLPNYKSISVLRMEGMPLREEDRFFKSGVSLQFSGTLADLHQFLQDVEKAKPGLRVDRLTINADGKDASRIGGQMVITAAAVVLKKGKNG